MICVEDISDEVANFFQTMTMSTTRRIPAKNVVDGVGMHFDLLPPEYFHINPTI